MKSQGILVKSGNLFLRTAVRRKGIKISIHFKNLCQLPGKKSLKNRRRKLEKVGQKSGKSQGILRFKFGRHPEKIHKIGHSCINYIH